MLYQAIKPTVLIGTSGVGRTFTQEVVETMASFNEVLIYEGANDLSCTHFPKKQNKEKSKISC